MDTNQLRNLKHELRTPVNHILGYSELLLEAANDAGNVRAAGQAENLHATGRSLARVVEKSLAHSDTTFEGNQMDALRVGLRPIVQRILEIALPQSEMFAMTGYRDDLKKICEAAEQLLELVHCRNVAASK
jgi:signal transduction histidine kinase